MGTPEFAVASLDAIVKSRHSVAAVVTVPDKPAGRGKKLRPSPVKVYALEHDIPVLQPEKLKDEAFVKALQSFEADVFVVVAFRMLPEKVWSIPPKGTFNLHASLLPQYRGAAPINHAIMNGETKSGVTTFFIDKQIDTGKIIMQLEVPLYAEDTAGDLHDRLMEAGAGLVLETLDAIAEGSVREIPQEQLIKEGEQLKAAPKIFREDCRIDWNKSAYSIVNKIRGLSPYPAAFTELKDDKGKILTMKIYRARRGKSFDEDKIKAGTVFTDGESRLGVAAADAMVEIEELQLQGKKRMSVKAFLNGYRNPEKLKIEGL